jgi:hypothetical protein
VKSFKELKVWQKAHETTLAIYELTRGFPREELYGLTSQLRRAAASVGANIARGMWAPIGWRNVPVSADRPRFGE